MPLVLEAIGVSKAYPPRTGARRPSAGPVLAVDRVSCALGPGDTLGLVGESGCGKTTLAKLLLGLTPATAGEVRIQGRPVQGLRGPGLRAARRAVQLVFQDPVNSLNPRLTVEETLAEPFAIHRLATGAVRRAKVEALLEAVQLPAAYRWRLPRELSGGERQRVGIARALALDPQALICDEPIASLDLSVGTKILQLLRDLNRRRGTALLFISHDLRAVAWLCARIAVMRQGRLLEAGSTAEVLARPRDPYTVLLLRSAALDLDAA